VLLSSNRELIAPLRSGCASSYLSVKVDSKRVNSGCLRQRTVNGTSQQEIFTVQRLAAHFGIITHRKQSRSQKRYFAHYKRSSSHHLRRAPSPAFANHRRTLTCGLSLDRHILHKRPTGPIKTAPPHDYNESRDAVSIIMGGRYRPYILRIHNNSNDGLPCFFHPANR
jgi:hypothetical protein